MAKDPYWSDVVLLMHCDDFTDVVTGNSATLVGSPSIDTTHQKLGTGCLRCPAGSYVTFPDSDKWNLGGGAFTIEFFVRLASYSSYLTLLGQNILTSTYPSWSIQTNYYGYPFFQIKDTNNTNYNGYQNNYTLGLSWMWVCVQRDDLGTLTTFTNDTTYVNNSNFFYTADGGTGLLTIGAPSTTDAYFDEIRITKGVARYSTQLPLANVPTAPFPEHPYEIWTASVSETMLADGLVGPGNFNFDAVTDYASVNGVLIPTEFATASEVIAITHPLITPATGRAVTTDEAVQVTDAHEIIMGSIIADYASLAESLDVGARVSAALNELVKVQEAASVGVPVEVTDTVGVLWALNVAQGATVAEKLGISEVLNYPFLFSYSVADAIGAYDTLARFLSYDISETITASETMEALARHIAAVSDSLSLTEDLSPHFILKLELNDDAIFDDAFDLRMIYRPEVREQITISALYVSPDGGITTWAVNTRTGAVTEYDTFAFNSFAHSGVHYLGASDNGLYALDGSDDDGAPTVAHLRSGYAQFGGSRFTSFAGAYIGMRGNGDIFLKLNTADGKTYTYKTLLQDQQTTKVRLGKGLRARYFAFELITEGQDFDLDTIEFVPLVATRRV